MATTEREREKEKQNKRTRTAKERWSDGCGGRDREITECQMNDYHANHFGSCRTKNKSQRRQTKGVKNCCLHVERFVGKQRMEYVDARSSHVYRSPPTVDWKEKGKSWQKERKLFCFGHFERVAKTRLGVRWKWARKRPIELDTTASRPSRCRFQGNMANRARNASSSRTAHRFVDVLVQLPPGRA